MFLIRTLHKWFGLIVGLQLVLWALSGAVMALLDHHKVSAEDAVLAVARLPVPQVLSLDRVSTTLGEPILKLELKPLYDRYVYEVTTPKGVKLIDAVSAAPVVVDAAAARAFAVARFSGAAEPTSVTLVEKATLETRKLKRTVWRVEFGDSERHTFLVSRATGEVLAVKNDTWRLWDIAWMLHIMDYDDRESFNHPLIVTVAMAAAWLALSGLILLFRAFRRSDFAWLLDRIPGRGARLKNERNST
jgi:uncharacterized iron-regulated membrane protein